MSLLHLWFAAALALLSGASAHAADPLFAAHQLTRARDAAERLDYAGTVIRQQGPELQTARITHQADARGGMELTELLDGPPREYVRRGADLRWYLPAERRIIDDRRANGHSFPGLSFADAAQLLSHYRAGALAADRVAGHRAQVTQLQPLDGLRYGYRFWFDAGSGLLLRVQSINETGQVVAQTGFSELQLGASAARRLRQHRVDTRGWQVERAASGPADVSGWSFRLPAGFRLSAAQRRVIAKSQGGIGEPREVVQAVFSDGLAGISIFIEPWSAVRSSHPVQRGAVNMVGKRVGKFWLTIVGEVPMAAIRQIADNLEFSAPATK